MYDDMSDEVGIFDFDELANHLLEQGQEASPAVCHGCLSGLLAAGGQHSPESGLDALTQTLDLTAHGDLAERLMQLYTTTALALVDDEFSFHPLLPDDEVEIATRTDALAQWCKGFLAGFALVSAKTEGHSQSLTQDSGEILTDIAAMAEADVGDEDKGGEDEDDELENSYMELVEYLRFAVLNLFTDSAGAAVEAAGSAPPSRPLH